MATFIYISVAFSKQIVRKIQSSCSILIFEKQESRKIKKITIITILKNSLPKTWDNVSFGDSSCSHMTILLKLPGTLTITEECNQINSCFSQTFQIFSPCLTISFGVATFMCFIECSHQLFSYRQKNLKNKNFEVLF